MPDIRSQRVSLRIPSVIFNYKVEKDLYGSFDVLLTWDFDKNTYPDGVEFRVYKAILGKPRLLKSYTISQQALEKLTGNKNLTAKSNILYNKSLISQNSKVTVENSNSIQHQKNESAPNLYSFFNISRIKASVSQQKYRFLDKNVKFGETYNYYVTVVTKNHQETTPSPLLVNVEWPYPPEAPKIFETSELSDGILLTVGNNQDSFISKFLIFRREDSEIQFQLLTEIQNLSEVLHFVDKTAAPKKNYIYRAYSQDIFGNLSAMGVEKTAVYRFLPITTNIEYRPNISVSQLDSKAFNIDIQNTNVKQVSFIKIERKDDWKFETSFSVKKYNEEYWSSNMFFNENNEINFVDRGVEAGREYSYKFTSFNHKGQPVSYTFTPPMKVGEKYADINIQQPSITPPAFTSFNLNLVSSRQDPAGVKFDWKISGQWSHLIIKTDDQTIKVDNIHNSIVLNSFEKNRNYIISIELYDLNQNKTIELTNLILNT